LNFLAGRYGILLTGMLIFISRLPFLNAGYGSEEDAWGMALTAHNISQTGIYEYSRLPGHPVPELIYAAIYSTGYFGFNLLTAIISTAGMLFFMAALRLAGIRNYLAAGIALAFTPVIYIASTNTMDYTWALAFIMVAFYLLLSGHYALAGIAMGIAIGCRITSAFCILPFLFLLNVTNSFRPFSRPVIAFVSSAIFVSFILFLPLFNRYGLGFFTFYDTIYPTFAKAFYKFTFAVYGTIGSAVLLLYFILTASNKTIFRLQDPLHQKLRFVSVIVILGYSVLYWYLPQKAAFMIPVIPFIILFFAIHLPGKKITTLAICMVASGFFLGVNLYDPYRGGKPSTLAIPFNAGRQQAAFDPVMGPVTDEYSKRKQCLSFAASVVKRCETFKEKTAVVAGWWQGYLLLAQDTSAAGHTVFHYYATENTLKELKEKGYRIFYLPEQDYFNDQRYGSEYTKQYAREW